MVASNPKACLTLCGVAPILCLTESGGGERGGGDLAILDIIEVVQLQLMAQTHDVEPNRFMDRMPEGFRQSLYNFVAEEIRRTIPPDNHEDQDVQRAVALVVRQARNSLRRLRQFFNAGRIEYRTDWLINPQQTPHQQNTAQGRVRSLVNILLERWSNEQRQRFYIQPPMNFGFDDWRWQAGNEYFNDFHDRLNNATLDWIDIHMEHFWMELGRNA